MELFTVGRILPGMGREFGRELWTLTMVDYETFDSTPAWFNDSRNSCQGQIQMNVADATKYFDNIQENHVLVARGPPFTWGSEAKFVELDEAFEVPHSDKAAGFELLLDKDDIEMLMNDLSRKLVGARTVAEFMIHYALHDAPPAWFDDLRDKA